MIEYLAALQATAPALVYTIVLCFGLIVGSFLNVVIYRLPVIMERAWQAEAHELLELPKKVQLDRFNLVLPNSRCPACGHAIKPWENIPVISYLFLRGRCSACRTHISVRYPLVELLTAGLTLIVVAHFGLTLAGLACVLLTFGLIAASMIDYDHTLIPDSITLPLLWLGLIVNSFDAIVPFADAFWGAIAGYMVLWIIYHVFKLITGKEGMGFGDFKLLAMLGAFMGWQMLPLIIILSSFAGALIGGSLIALGRDRAKPIPFGPYLAIAGFIALIWGNEITARYLQFADV
jgi:leader peptidase (prepilin peptidase)/N-methyltransferase